MTAEKILTKINFLLIWDFSTQKSFIKVLRKESLYFEKMRKKIFCKFGLKLETNFRQKTQSFKLKIEIRPIFVYKVTTEFVKCVKYACSNHFYLSSTLKLTGSKWTKQSFGRKNHQREIIVIYFCNSRKYIFQHGNFWKEYILKGIYFNMEIFERNQFIFKSKLRRDTYLMICLFVRFLVP